jgi:hypothetical protein
VNAERRTWGVRALRRALGLLPVGRAVMYHEWKDGFDAGTASMRLAHDLAKGFASGNLELVEAVERVERGIARPVEP